jgi:hypothetical protein
MYYDVVTDLGHPKYLRICYHHTRRWHKTSRRLSAAGKAPHHIGDIQQKIIAGAITSQKHCVFFVAI